VYGNGKSYNIFAGKDGSRGLGLSSLKPEHANPDYTVLEEKDRATLEQWYKFFS
jgi:membrane-associated progesterone receptor component